MPKRNAETNYNTNLASEYLIMSHLNRMGKDAYLSLGNKKGVDIIVMTKKQAYAIIEVKGVNKKNDWLITNTGRFASSKNLFYCLLCFNGDIKDISQTADFWLIPSEKLASDKTALKISSNKTTVYLSYKEIAKPDSEYIVFKNNFNELGDYIEKN